MDARDYPPVELTATGIGAFYETYTTLGFGFLESVYENALAIQLELCGLSFERQRSIDVRYRGRVVGEFRADIVIEERVLVEIKAASALLPAHDAQLINYLKGTGLHLGLLLNFDPRAQVRRRIFRPASIS